ncbi:MAG TPA: O-methyltransferase [Vicinamibacterales bacterium]|nr:O-methyltransferase [Vicinamibacterales bacterium]
MGQIVADAVEAYLARLHRAGDALLDEVERDARAEGLPIIGPEAGAFLHVLARVAGARRILEIGTAIGYSTLWLARALPDDGLLISFEIDEARAARARTTLERAGLGGRAHVMTGDALLLVNKVAGPFDLVFNDGDKQQYLPLLDPLVARLRPGGVLITDNILWGGAVVPGFAPRPSGEGRHPDDPDTAAIARYNERLSADPRLVTAFVPLRDGIAISVKVETDGAAGARNGSGR